MRKQSVHIVGALSHAIVQIGTQLSGAHCQIIDILGKRLSLQNSKVPHGIAFRLIQNIRNAGEEIVERSAQIRIAQLADQTFQLRIGLLSDLRAGAVAGGVPQPLLQETVDLLHDALNLNARAEQQVATSLRWSRLQLHNFAV